MATIEELLSSLELGQYAAKFKQEEIDANGAKGLSLDELKDMGLTLGARKKLYAALHPVDATPATATATAPAAAAAAASASTSSRDYPATPIPNLWKARGEYKSALYGIGPGSMEGLPTAFYADPLKDDDSKLIATLCYGSGRIPASSIAVLDKSSLSVGRIVNFTDKDMLGTAVVNRSLIGRGQHLAVAYNKPSTSKGNAIAILSNDDFSIVTRLDSTFDSGDSIHGIAYASDQKVAALCYRNAQNYDDADIVVVDTNTGEPLSTADLGKNVVDLNTSPDDNVLSSHVLVPNVLFQTTQTRVLLLDVRQNLSKPVQVWAGAPGFSQLFFEHRPYGGAHRIALNCMGREENSQIWDMRQNKVMYTVPPVTKFVGIHRNAVVGLGGEEVTVWDLTKQASGEKLLGAPVKKV